MPTFVSLINYTDKGIREISDSPKRLDLAKKILKEMGGEIKDFYLTIGSYDIIVVAEAPSDEIFAKFLLEVGSTERIRTNTLKAFPEADYRKIIEELP